MQKVELANAPASSSAKNVKPPVKHRKKSSPLDALIQMIAKEKEAVDLEDEWSFAAFVTKDPYYPYN